MKRDTRTPTLWTSDPVPMLPRGQEAFTFSGTVAELPKPEPAPLPVEPAKPAAPLRWYRCSDCLGVFTTPDTVCGKPLCGVCGGKCEFQGMTAHTVQHDAAACDDRCITARGRNCECSCGGKNHGTWRTVRITVQAGIAALGKPRDHAKLLAGVEAFRAAREAAREALDARFGDIFRLKSSGAYLSSEDFGRYLTGRDFASDVREACAAKVHSLRLSKLASVTARIRGDR